MTYIVRDYPEGQRYEISDGDERVGLIQYRRAPDQISFTHTETDPASQGVGVGSILVRHVLSEARASGLAVLPFCPFVRQYIAGHEEFLDLVPQDRRGAFGLGD